MISLKKELTSRELEVLRYLSEGLNSREIAKKMYISINTVQYHRKQLLNKMQARNVAELIGKGFRARILSLK